MPSALCHESRHDSCCVKSSEAPWVGCAERDNRCSIRSAELCDCPVNQSRAPPAAATDVPAFVGPSTSTVRPAPAARPAPAVRTASGRVDSRVKRGQNDTACCLNKCQLGVLPCRQDMLLINAFTKCSRFISAATVDVNVMACCLSYMTLEHSYFRDGVNEANVKPVAVECIIPAVLHAILLANCYNCANFRPICYV